MEENKLIYNFDEITSLLSKDFLIKVSQTIKYFIKEFTKYKI